MCDKWVWQREINGHICRVKFVDLFSKEREKWQKAHLSAEDMPLSYNGWYCGYVEVKPSDGEIYELARSDKTEAITQWFWDKKPNCAFTEINYTGTQILCLDVLWEQEAKYAFTEIKQTSKQFPSHATALFIGFDTMHPFLKQTEEEAVTQAKWIAEQLPKEEKR